MANERLHIQAAGSSQIRAAGGTQDFEVGIAGSAWLDSKDLVSGSVAITISGSGDAVVHATQSLHTKISGSGSVTYYGEPGDVSQSVAGSGSVKRAE